MLSRIRGPRRRRLRWRGGGCGLPALLSLVLSLSLSRARQPHVNLPARDVVRRRESAINEAALIDAYNFASQSPFTLCGRF